VVGSIKLKNQTRYNAMMYTGQTNVKLLFQEAISACISGQSKIY